MVTVIGAGLAGCEAAWQLANRDIKVRLYEMKPIKYTPAHSYSGFAELVCSNSLRSDRLENAVGLLKEEMRHLGSLIIKCGDSTRVPAGGALAVDREGFSNLITQKIKAHPNIEVIQKELTAIPEGNVIIATGPLTSDAMAEAIKGITGGGHLYFYDAAAPIVELSSIDMSRAFRAARYGKGGDDYINCPMDKAEYEAFYNELINAERAPLNTVDKEVVFEGCMPVEKMAARGIDTLLFGPLKPVGLTDPKTDKQAHAVVQLRQDNKEGTLYNIVGFQTHLKWGEQKRVFGMIPALKNAVFARYGVMHRNTYINSPVLLDAYYQVKAREGLFFAGQITGVEGYVESASSGLVAGLNLAHLLLGKEKVSFPKTTAIGSLAHYISGGAASDFQPMNANFGIMEPLNQKIRNKMEKNLLISQRAIEEIENIKGKL